MYYRDYSVNKFAKGGDLAIISEKDFANNRVIKKGNIEIELSKDYPTNYYAHFIDMSKEGGELISVYADKNWNKVVKEIETFKYAKGGEIKYNPQGIASGYPDEDYSRYVIFNLKNEMVKSFDLEEDAINWVSKSKKGKDYYKIEKEKGDYAKGGRMDQGGSIMDYNDDVYDNDYDNKDDELMGFNVMINTKKDYNKFKKFYLSDADDMGDNTLFFSFDDEKKADKKIVILENHFKRLNINDYFIQKVYSSEFN